MNLVESISIAYSDIFDDYEQVDITSLLRDIPSKNSLEILAYFMAQTHIKEDKGTNRQLDYLKMWVGRMPRKVVWKAAEFMAKVASGAGDSRFNFINNVSVLMLMEYVLETYNALPKTDNLTPEQELQLFKAYLWCSETWTRKQSEASNIREIKDMDGLAAMIITTQFPISELTEWKHFAPQFIKAAYFFNFCEHDEVFKEYLKVFLLEQKAKTWEQYLTNIFNVYQKTIKELKPAYQLHVSEDHQDILTFLRNLTIDPNTFKRSDDFKLLREKPLFEIESNTFLFLNLNFLVDKFFQGVQFAMSAALIKHKATYNGKVIVKYDHFKSIYASEFSEKVMFYRVLKFMFENNKYVMFDGSRLKEILKDGEPDFYIRDNGKIYIFEYKDVTIDAGTKHSHSYEKIRAKLFEKMVSNQDNSSKGISQLVNTIQTLTSGGFTQIDRFNASKVIIYPLIVCTDQALNVGGVNYILNKEFRRLLREKDIPDANIKNLTIVDFDTLLKYQDLFNIKKLKINNCLNEYHEDTSRIKKTPFDMLNPFNIFMNGKTENMQGRIPKALFEEAKRLFKFK